MARATKEFKPSWSNQLLALIGLAGVGSVIAYVIPPLNIQPVYFGETSLTYHQLLTLILLTALTVMFLAYYRARLFFSTRWLVAAAAYNSLILFVKFTISANQFKPSIGTSFSSILTTAGLVSLLYIGVFGLLYLFFDGRLLNRSLHKSLITSRQGKLLLATGLFMVATILRIVFFRLPVLSTSDASGYVSDIFRTETTLISGFLFVIILAAVEAFAQVRRRSDLKYFFVTGSLLIVIFHVWWAIFIYRGF